MASNCTVCQTIQDILSIVWFLILSAVYPHLQRHIAQPRLDNSPTNWPSAKIFVGNLTTKGGAQAVSIFFRVIVAGTFAKVMAPGFHWPWLCVFVHLGLVERLYAYAWDGTFRKVYWKLRHRKSRDTAGEPNSLEQLTQNSERLTITLTRMSEYADQFSVHKQLLARLRKHLEEVPQHREATAGHLSDDLDELAANVQLNLDNGQQLMIDLKEVAQLIGNTGQQEKPLGLNIESTKPQDQSPATPVVQDNFSGQLPLRGGVSFQPEAETMTSQPRSQSKQAMTTGTASRKHSRSLPLFYRHADDPYFKKPYASQQRGGHSSHHYGPECTTPMVKLEPASLEDSRLATGTNHAERPGSGSEESFIKLEFEH